ncbi:MAG: hypothetical protein RBU27_05535 [Bacteroidota bacterium]|jgi:hypothetical protein|nr:hypothetical protein [Bacteroidota bacterium]
MHGEADPWARKIRRSIEQVFWKNDNIARVHGSSKALYHRPADGDPLLEMDRMRFDDVVSGIFERALLNDAIPELVMIVFDLLSEKPDCCHALTVAELTRILRCYFERIYWAEPDKSIEEIPVALDDRERGQIDGILARIRNGRLVHYRESGVFSESECQSVLVAVEKYLVGLYQQCPRHPHEYLQEVYPGYQQRWQEGSERKRLSNFFHLARKMMKIEKDE